MMLEEQYARALFDLVSEAPDKAALHLKNLRAVLEQKGHAKLAPRIFSRYQLILKRKERSKNYQATNPQEDRTRTLLELYRTLSAVS